MKTIKSCKKTTMNIPCNYNLFVI